MQYKWLNKKLNREIIIFFNGWGMDDSVVKHLDPKNKDIIMFYDYNTLDTDFDFSILDKYEKRHLVAWSMGVMVATNFDIEYRSSTAVNGTLEPISNSFGIPNRIYDLTIRGFSPSGAKKFIQNMFNTTTDLPNVNREFENQKTELVAIKSYTANKNFKYNKIFISNEDKIIPTKNQVAYWNIEPNLNAGHCPFVLFDKWDDLI